MERLLLEAHTVQNFNLKPSSAEGGASEGVGADADAVVVVLGGESTLPSRNGDVVGPGCTGGSTGTGVAATAGAAGGCDMDAAG
jgi:hypothetical protein